MRVKVSVSWPSFPRSGVASQKRMVPSALAEARRRPSGLNATHAHLSVCPCRASTSRPVVASQMRTVLSSPPEARRRPLRLKATHSTFPVCKSKVCLTSPVVEFDSFTVLSKLAEANHLPSRLNASAADGMAMRVDSAKQQSCFRVPKAQAFPEGAGRQPAVAAERHGDRMEVVTGQLLKELTVLPVPDPYQPVTSRRDLLAVGTECNGICRPKLANGIVVRFCEHWLVGRRQVPDLYLPVRAEGGQVLARRGGTRR